MAARRKTSRSNTNEEAVALELTDSEKFESENSFDYTKSCMIQYGKQTLENRAVPDYRDGLIPVQRRILYTMFKQKQGWDSQVKAAKVVGSVLGNLHPHGDTSCYSAMVTLVQAPIKFIDGSGNWGAYDNPQSYAAYRYTTCQLSDIAKAVFFTGYLTKAHDLIANFDGSDTEPVVLHCNIPVALVLGKVSGIAVGLATNIPSFTIESVAHLTKLALKGKTITPKMCQEHLVFTSSWGKGTIHQKHLDDGSLANVFKKGTGGLTFLPEYVYDKANENVQVTGLPLNCNYESAVEKTHSKGYPFSDGTTVTSKGLEISINLKKTRTHKPTKADFDEVIKLWTGRTFATRIAVTDRQLTDAAINEGAASLDIEIIPEIGVADLINKWAAYRLDLEIKMAGLEKEDLQLQADKLDLIILARNNIDTIHKAWKVDKPVEYLATQLGITIEQSKYIFGLTIMRLTKIDVSETKSKIKDLKSRIKECNTRIKSPSTSAVACVDNILTKFGGLK